MAAVQIETTTVFFTSLWHLQPEGANFRLAPHYSVKELGNVAA